MSGHDEHRLGRSLSRATIDAVEAREKHIAALAPLAPGDMSQQLLLEVQGKIGGKPVFQETSVYWPNPFTMRVSSPSTSDSTYTNPHFNSGVEILSPGHVMIDVQVADWISDDSDLVIGAKVRVTVWSPGAPKKKDYKAIVHLTFFGYAAPQLDDDDLM